MHALELLCEKGVKPALTLGQNEDVLLSAGNDGLAELGSLCIANLDVVFLFNVSEDMTYIL